MKAQINLPIESLANGAVQEKLNVELEKVFKNIADVNTKSNAKRSVTVKLDFYPNDERDKVDLTVQLKTTLAPVTDVNTLVLTEEMDGKVYANELKSGAKGQTYIDPDDATLKTDAGEPIEEVERKNNQIIDLQAKKG